MRRCNGGMKKLILIATLLAVMPATLQAIQVRGRSGETCYVLLDSSGKAVAVRCARPSLET